MTRHQEKVDNLTLTIKDYIYSDYVKNKFLNEKSLEGKKHIPCKKVTQVLVLRDFYLNFRK